MNNRCNSCGPARSAGGEAEPCQRLESGLIAGQKMRKLPSSVRKNRIYDFVHIFSVTSMFGAFCVSTGLLILTMTDLMTVDKTKYLEDQRIIEEARIAQLQMEEEAARLKSKQPA
ncbi:hypothetical protein FSP39_010771 [Pinctada imbricata]|uniref:Uncharacterized protein n=1 Tax=Pinctada imbricata TaxID=66713 RepID=A0AA88YQ90_PINIB|nr:hypothetical protein FSP39_010771 [Pinctada imbricata]